LGTRRGRQLEEIVCVAYAVAVGMDITIKRFMVGEPTDPESGAKTLFLHIETGSSSDWSMELLNRICEAESGLDMDHVFTIAVH